MKRPQQLSPQKLSPQKFNPRTRGGFTLVEVLLVLMIMGGILLSMTQILTAARTSRDTIENIKESRLVGPAILDRIERDLRGLFVYNRSDLQHMRVVDRVMLGLDGDSLDFVSTTDSVSLHADFDRYVRTDVNEIGYRLRENPEEDDFLELYRREDAGVDDEPFDGGNYIFLHDRVKAFNIELFAEDGEDAEVLEEWGEEVNSGDGSRGLPARIHLTLTLELSQVVQNDQIRILPPSRRTVTYSRIFRVPQPLRLAEADMPVPVVPTPPGVGGDSEDGNAAGGGGAGGAALDQNLNADGTLGDIEQNTKPSDRGRGITGANGERLGGNR